MVDDLIAVKHLVQKLGAEQVRKSWGCSSKDREAGMPSSPRHLSGGIIRNGAALAERETDAFGLT